MVESPSKDCYCHTLLIPDRQPESLEEELHLMKCSNCIASSQPIDEVETEIVDLEDLANTMISETVELEPMNDSLIAPPAETEIEVAQDTPTRKLRRLDPLVEECVFLNSPIEEPCQQSQLQESDVLDVSWFMIFLLCFDIVLIYIYNIYLFSPAGCQSFPNNTHQLSETGLRLLASPVMMRIPDIAMWLSPRQFNHRILLKGRQPGSSYGWCVCLI